MTLFMEFLNASQYKTAYLSTTDELKTAASLYVRHGFKLTGKKESTGFAKSRKELRYDLNVN